MKISAINQSFVRTINPFQTNVFIRKELPNDVFVKSNPISFKGEEVGALSKEELEKAKTKLENSKREYSMDNNLAKFRPAQVDNILNSLNKKNIKYLDDLLMMNNSKLTDIHITQMLNYITTTKESDKVIKQKMDFTKNIGKTFAKEVPVKLYDDFMDNIGNPTFPLILKSDLAIEGKASSSFRAACDKIYSRLVPKKDDPYEKSLAKQKFCSRYLGELLFAGSIFSTNTFDDLTFNRLRSFDVYAKRLQILEKRDVNYLRLIGKDGVDQNHDDDIYGLSVNDTITAFHLISLNRHLLNSGYKGINFDSDNYKMYINEKKFIPDLPLMQKKLLRYVLEYSGINEEDKESYLKKYANAFNKNRSDGTKIDNSVFWDTDYVHLLMSEKRTPLNDIIKVMTENVARTPINELDSQEVFISYITDTSNKYGRRNAKTKEIFENENLDYEKWLKPEIEATSAKFTSRSTPWQPLTKTFSAKVWNRIPQESLFDGNYTTCCTGIDKEHGDSFPEYLLSTFTNTIEIRNERGEVSGMSRIFMTKINGEVALLIENMEMRNLSNARYLHINKKKEDQNAVNRYREMIFDYAENLADHINLDKSRKIPVYFATSYPKIKGITNGLDKIEGIRKLEILGSTPDKIYINTFGDDVEGYDKTGEADRIEFLTSNLINVTENRQKAKTQ